MKAMVRGAIWLVFGGAALLAAGCPANVGTLQGHVVAPGVVISGAVISLVGTPYQAVSNAMGEWQIAGVPAGDYTITCVAAGYKTQTWPVTVLANSVWGLDFLMEPAR